MSDISAMSITGEIRPVNVTGDIGTGYAVSAEKPGKYSLIESITLEEDTGQIIRTAEPDGTPLNLEAAYILITAPAYTEARTVLVSLGSDPDVSNIWGTVNERIANFTQKSVDTRAMKTTVIAEKEHGLFRSYRIAPSAEGNPGTVVGYNGGRIEENIHAIRIAAVTNTTNLIPAGVKIDVWGVRAGE